MQNKDQTSLMLIETKDLVLLDHSGDGEGVNHRQIGSHINNVVITTKNNPGFTYRHVLQSYSHRKRH